ncbi:MAG: glycosyltransferase [Elusimicrobia bacterium]|nr:glycosyltransferase [Elusimicrobiota bacterium]
MSATKVKVFEVLECGGPGGTGNQVAAICNGLDPAAFEVGLVFNARDGRPEDYRKAASGAKTFFHVPELTREISPASDFKALGRLKEIFKAERPDVVHLHSSKAGFLGRLAAKAAGVRKIYYSPHGYGFLQQDRGAASRTLYKSLEKMVSGIGEIVAVSPSEAELARELSGGRPVHTVCDGYLGQDDAASAPHEGIVVGGCGRLTAARNPDAFVNLCQRLTDSRNGLRCVWIGGGEEEARFRRHLENMNMLAKVELTGWLAPSAAREKLRGLDLFVHYSRWDGLANSVLEAMAQALPVVASDIPANRDAVVHGETGFLAKNEMELLELCLKLVDDQPLRRKLGDAGRARVAREFSHAEALRRLSELYRG